MFFFLYFFFRKIIFFPVHNRMTNIRGYHFWKINNVLANSWWRGIDRNWWAGWCRDKQGEHQAMHICHAHSKKYMSEYAREAGWWRKENNFVRELIWMWALSGAWAALQPPSRQRSISDMTLYGLCPSWVCPAPKGSWQASLEPWLWGLLEMLCMVVTAGGATGYLHTWDFQVEWIERRGSFQLTVYTLPPASAGCGLEWRMLLRTSASPKSHIYSMAQACIHSPGRLYYSQKKLIKISHAS